MTISELKIQAKRLRHEFDLDGYVSIPGFFSLEEIEEIRGQLDRFIQEVVPTLPPAEVYYDDKEDHQTLKQIQQLGRHDPYFEQLVSPGSRLATLSEICLEEPVRPVNLQYFNKPATVSTPTPPHQDGYFFCLTPCRAITLWIALEDIAPEQGCLNYVQGSHRYGMRAHGSSGVLGFSQAILDFGHPFDRENARSFPCQAGHLMAHHALTIHWAEGNRSGDRTRQAMGAVFYGKSSREDVETKRAYQARLDAELAAQGKI